MTDRSGIVAMLFVLALSTAGCDRQVYSVTGRIMNARTNEPVADATIIARSPDTSVAHSGKGGYYVLAGLLRRDTVDVSAGGFKREQFVVAFTLNGPTSRKQDVYLEPDVDTAYTSGGPVDASFFLDQPGLKPKKLSMNEARLRLAEEFPDVRIRKGALVQVGESEEWLFELKMGRASASVYLDAHTGKITSIESDDPTMDRELQLHVGR
jgi:hypothetical protein